MVNSHCEAGSAIQLAIPISYPTRVNGLFVLLNCQPSLIYFYKTFPVIEENSGCEAGPSLLLSLSLSFSINNYMAKRRCNSW